jgi:hypothetical protein
MARKNDIAAAENLVETCPACTSAVDAKAAICLQCGAGLDYFRQQNKAPAQSSAETVQTDAAKPESASE